MEAATMPQHLSALAMANRVKSERVALREEIRAGRIDIDTALDHPVANYVPQQDARARQTGMKIGELISAQSDWGPRRTAKFLARLEIRPERPVWMLTSRQRLAIVAAQPGRNR